MPICKPLLKPVLVALAILVGGCSSPPKPPTVDDAKKRPVNVSQALDLQVCRTELSAAQVVLTEALATARSNQALAAAPQTSIQPAAATAVLLPARIAAPPEPNQVFVINFPLGSADLNVSAAQRAQLSEQARAAKFILIRGRTDAVADSMAETRLAQRRAEAAYKYLVDMVRLPPEGIRLAWQGAGDPFEPGSTAANRQANRRVEIELYQTKPEVQMLTLLRELSPRDPPLRDSPRQVGVASVF